MDLQQQQQQQQVLNTTWWSFKKKRNPFNPKHILLIWENVVNGVVVVVRGEGWSLQAHQQEREKDRKNANHFTDAITTITHI